jgi:NTP pyrophosphatase (non-canonical NTP hydrolase)
MPRQPRLTTTTPIVSSNASAAYYNRRTTEIMTFGDYQDAARRTARADREWETRVSVAGLGLAGESGEVAELIKKLVGHGADEQKTREKVLDELGDVLWYVAEVASTFGLPLSSVAAHNVDKLRARYPEGFVTGGGNR